MALQELAATLQKNAAFKVEVAGYTDNLGPDDFNQRLSQLRAESVKAYLISQGVAETQLTAKGYGSTNPLADSSSEAGRSKNRRVELHILR